MKRLHVSLAVEDHDRLFLDVGFGRVRRVPGIENGQMATHQ